MSNPNRDKLVDMSKRHYLARLNEEKKMSDDPRNTQFVGWAKAVVDEIFGISKKEFPRMLTPEEARLVLARAGYDLVMHAVRNVDPLWENPKLKFIEDTEEIVKDVPDLAELPEEQER